jgi:RNA polymerase sigma-B factor
MPPVPSTGCGTGREADVATTSSPPVRRAPGDYEAEREWERLLLLRYHRGGDLAARERLIERLLPLAHRLARRYASRGESLEDLEQVAVLGLLKAVDRYDPNHGSSFITYATPTILGELKRHFRDKGWAIRISRDLQELALSVDRTNEQLLQVLGRRPRAGEVADALGVTTEQVLEAIEARTAYGPASLDRPLSDERDPPMTLGETLGEEDDGYELVDGRVSLRRAWQALSPREQEILKLRFGEALTQHEIGQRIGCSQMHVSRLLRRALARLSAVAEAE